MLEVQRDREVPTLASGFARVESRKERRRAMTGVSLYMTAGYTKYVI